MIEDFFPWSKREEIGPLIISVDRDTARGKFNESLDSLVIYTSYGICVRTRPMSTENAVSETKRVLKSLKEEGYKIAYADIPDGWSDINDLI